MVPGACATAATPNEHQIIDVSDGLCSHNNFLVFGGNEFGTGVEPDKTVVDVVPIVYPTMVPAGLGVIGCCCASDDAMPLSSMTKARTAIRRREPSYSLSTETGVPAAPEIA